MTVWMEEQIERQIERQIEMQNKEGAEKGEDIVSSEVNTEKISWFRYMVQDQAGIGVVEVILILVVLIGLVLIFKSQLTSLVESIFETIVSESSGI